MSSSINPKRVESPIGLRRESACSGRVALSLRVEPAKQVPLHVARERVAPLRRKSPLLLLVSMVVLPLVVSGDVLAMDDSSPGLTGKVRTETTLMQSAYVQFDEREAEGGISESGAGGPGNNQAREPTRSNGEYQVISIPRISF
ncbi:hypothetical protein SA496_22250 [Pseudomonas sp. JS3066]|uniref:hypothetical protein n=1 Tax=unclassified Pseudomonas TaxID=196821 RepID=UPI002E7C2413|nr:hypothetical protein [Pseudomonas sp. JS3066]WVK92406.1 hypothetical protein SA496_22250 [Pseudomonas sp. JS3066]